MSCRFIRFKINLKKNSDVRVIHRNKIMKCEELALDTFDDDKRTPAIRIKPAIPTGKVKPREPKIQLKIDENDELDGQESDNDSMIVLVEEREPEFLNEILSATDPVNSPETVLSEPVVVEEEEIDQSNTEAADVEERVVETDQVQDEAAEETEGEDADDAEEISEDEDAPPAVRRSSRRHVAAKKFTFDSVGGNPVLTAVGEQAT